MQLSPDSCNMVLNCINCKKLKLLIYKPYSTHWSGFTVSQLCKVVLYSFIVYVYKIMYLLIYIKRKYVIMYYILVIRRK